MTTRQQIYEQLNDPYLSSEVKRSFGKQYEVLLEKEASTVAGVQPTLQPRYTISVGNKTFENKMINEKGEIVDMQEEPPLLVESIKATIKEFDRNCYRKEHERRRYYEEETSDCTQESLQRLLARGQKKRLTMPLFPVLFEEDFKTNDTPTEKWEVMFGMDNVFNNMDSYRKFKVGETLKLDGKKMRVLQSYIDASRFPLYKFGVARSAFPVEAVTPRVLAFSEVKMTDDMQKIVHRRQLHRRKTAWLVSMYCALASKLSCICKKVNETAKLVATMCYHRPKSQEAYNKRVKTIYEGTKKLPEIPKETAFQAGAMEYLKKALKRDVNPANPTVEGDDPTVQQFLKIVEKGECELRHVIQLALLEPIEQYERPYSEMNLQHEQYKRLLMSFVEPLVRVVGWEAGINAKSKSSANKPTQTAYVLKWLGEISMHFGSVKLDFSLIDDATIQGSLVNGLRKQLCDSLDTGVKSFIATFPENEKGVKAHTTAFLRVLFRRNPEQSEPANGDRYFNTHDEDGNAWEAEVDPRRVQETRTVDYGAIDVVRLDRMTRTMSDIDYDTAFEFAKSLKDKLSRSDAFLILEILEPEKDEDKDFFASICYELAIDHLHSDHVATAVKYFEHSLSYDPLNHATKRRKVTCQILAIISELVGDADDAAFYKHAVDNPNKLKMLPSGKFKLIKTKPPDDVRKLFNSALLDLMKRSQDFPDEVEETEENLQAELAELEDQEISLREELEEAVEGSHEHLEFDLEQIEKRRAEVEQKLASVQNGDVEPSKKRASEVSTQIVALNLSLADENRKAAVQFLRKDVMHEAVFEHVQGYLKGLVERFARSSIYTAEMFKIANSCAPKDKNNKGDIMAVYEHNTAIEQDLKRLKRKLGFLGQIGEDTYPTQVSTEMMPWLKNPYIDSYCTIHFVIYVQLLSPDEPLFKRMQEHAEGKEQSCSDQRAEVLELGAYHFGNLKNQITNYMPALFPKKPKKDVVQQVRQPPRDHLRADDPWYRGH